MPLLFPTFDLGDGPVLDGGVADAIPFRRALEKGCDRVTVILTREPRLSQKAGKAAAPDRPRLPPLAEFPRGHAQPRPAV